MRPIEIGNRIVLSWGMGARAIFIHLAVAAIAVMPARADDIFSEPIQLAQRQSCRTVSTCREAVIMWCRGYARADGDSDGIPCENVCPNREIVRQILFDLGALAENSPICGPWLRR